jgi:hypothetical protein
MPGTNPWRPDLPQGDYDVGSYWSDGEKVQVKASTRYCNRASAAFDATLCAASGGTPFGRAGGGSEGDPNAGGWGSGDDWWSTLANESRQNPTRYDELLNITRDRFIQDPFQQAISSAADVKGGAGYGETIEDLYKMAGYPGDFRRQGASTAGDPATWLGKKLGEGDGFNYLQELQKMITQTQNMQSGAFGQAYGTSLGPATSMVQGAGSQLQGYRGQDQQRYLTEKGWEHEMEMMKMQLRAMANAQGGGGGLFDMLGPVLGLALGPAGGLLGLSDPFADWLHKLCGGGTGSGGGMNYEPGFLGGGY